MYKLFVDFSRLQFQNGKARKWVSLLTFHIYLSSLCFYSFSSFERKSVVSCLFNGTFVVSSLVYLVGINFALHSGACFDAGKFGGFKFRCYFCVRVFLDCFDVFGKFLKVFFFPLLYRDAGYRHASGGEAPPPAERADSPHLQQRQGRGCPISLLRCCRE